uniref:Uncharacterized protein n=1 Tax=Arundo donax TaxID=35708 RepID=A0A0A9D0Z6_ARUDO
MRTCDVTSTSIIQALYTSLVWFFVGTTCNNELVKWISTMVFNLNGFNFNQFVGLTEISSSREEKTGVLV